MDTRRLLWFGIGVLLFLGGGASVIGFSLAILSENSKIQNPATAPDITTPAMVSVTQTLNPPGNIVMPTKSSPESRVTSTPQPSLAENLTPPSQTETIVRSGESLYQICRRNCPGVWGLSEVPPSLINYAQSVSQHNGIPWNNGQPILQTGQLLQMLPCPNP